MIITTVSVGDMQVNCYLLAARPGGKAVIIDPGAQEAKIRQALTREGLEPGIIVNTHGHYDHIGCDNAFGVPVYAHPGDMDLLTNPDRNLSTYFDVPMKVTAELRVVRDGDRVSCDGIELDVLHIPGHTPGGIALLLRAPETGSVFTGDSLFYHAVGRTDLEGGDEAGLLAGIREKLLSLPPETIVYPGHGRPSSVGEESRANPFLRG